MSVKAKPDGYHTVTPYLLVADADAAIKFAEDVFGATVKERIVKPSTNATMHAEVIIGDSVVMMGCKKDSPGATGMLYVYVDDTDAVYAKALECDAKSIMEPADQFYGDRNAGVLDPQGNKWWIATHIEDIDSAELNRRANEYYSD